MFYTKHSKNFKLLLSILFVCTLLLLPLQELKAEESNLVLERVEITNKGDVSLTFNKEMADPTGTEAQFTVKADDKVIPVTKVEKTNTPEKIKLVLETKVNAAQEVLVSYIKSDDVTKQVKAADGQVVESFEGLKANEKVDGNKNKEIPVEETPTEEKENESKTVEFKDIENHWAKEDIILMASKSIVEGIDKETFAPDGKVTRAQFAAMLTRALNLSEGEQKASFSDVKGDEWFVKAINAANEGGIIKGYEDGSFKPNAPVTRQEVAVMLNRSLKILKLKPEVSDDDVQALIKQFKDGDKIAKWAQKPVATVAQEGIVKGMADGTFAPTKNCTRAEAVVMIKRLLAKANLL